MDGEFSDVIYASDISKIAWKELENFKLPVKMGLFGCMIFEDRFVIVFGGFGYKVESKSVYIFDSNKAISDWKWHKLAIEMPNGFAGVCNGLILDKHGIIHAFKRKKHASISLSSVLKGSKFEKLKLQAKEEKEEKKEEVIYYLSFI